MISRISHGWTTPTKADAYESLLKGEGLAGIQHSHIVGYSGALLPRRDLGGEVEFVTVTCCDSLEAVPTFAGEDYEVAVVLERARAPLQRFDERSGRYEVRAETEV